MPTTDDGNDAILTLFTDGFVALYTVAPTTSTPGTEVSGGSYAHQAVSLTQDVGDSSVFISVGDLLFPAMPTCDVVATGHFDSSDTTLIHYTVLDSPVHFDAGDDATVDAGQYVIDVS